MIAPACACRTQTGMDFVRNGLPRKEAVAMHTDKGFGANRVSARVSNLNTCGD